MIRHRNGTAPRRTNCTEVARVLQAYLDSETDKTTTRQVATHVEHCRSCTLETTAYQEIKDSLARRGLPDETTLTHLHNFGAALLTRKTPQPHNETAGLSKSR